MVTQIDHSQAFRASIKSQAFLFFTHTPEYFTVQGSFVLHTCTSDDTGDYFYTGTLTSLHAA